MPQDKRTLHKSKFGKVGFCDMATKNDYLNTFNSNITDSHQTPQYKFSEYDTQFLGFRYDKNRFYITWRV